MAQATQGGWNVKWRQAEAALGTTTTASATPAMPTSSHSIGSEAAAAAMAQHNTYNQPYAYDHHSQQAYAATWYDQQHHQHHHQQQQQHNGYHAPPGSSAEADAAHWQQWHQWHQQQQQHYQPYAQPQQQQQAQPPPPGYAASSEQQQPPSQQHSAHAPAYPPSSYPPQQAQQPQHQQQQQQQAHQQGSSSYTSYPYAQQGYAQHAHPPPGAWPSQQPNVPAKTVVPVPPPPGMTPAEAAAAVKKGARTVVQAAEQFPWSNGRQGQGDANQTRAASAASAAEVAHARAKAIAQSIGLAPEKTSIHPARQAQVQHTGEAFTRVEQRFSAEPRSKRAKATTAVEAAAAGVKETPYSEDLKNFAKSCFGAAGDDKILKEKVEVFLRKTITLVKQAGMHKDWSNEPLPGFLRKALKKKKVKERQVQVTDEKQAMRSARFNAFGMKGGRRKHHFQFDDEDEGDIRLDEPVKGSCMDIEKDYFRLNEAPDPASVRPPAVLRKSLDNVKRRYADGIGYKWICSQLKSIRQDLTVQQIRDEFTVKVYEAHARIALERNDPSEFHQCQSQLVTLYDEGVHGCHEEFLAYRILDGVYTDNKRNMNRLLQELTHENKQLPAVKHALRVRAACALNDYNTFFKLSVAPPNMGGYIMDLIAPRIRKFACIILFKAYRPALTLAPLCQLLAFEDEKQALEFLQKLEVEVEPTGRIDCRKAMQALASKDTMLKLGPA